MSSFDDSSEASFDESGSFAKDEPPTLDETLFDIKLFSTFLTYMKSQQAAPNLNFLKMARLYRLYNAPRDAYVKEAMKMIWTFFSDCAPMPVNVTPEVKKKLQDISLDPEMELTLDKDTFSVAFGEVYNSVVPHFRDWIATNEWREISFHRIAPPHFNIVLTSNTLRVLFNKYLKNQLEHDSDGSVAHAFHLWKFCVIANDFRDGKFSHSSHIEAKKKGEAGGDGEKSEKPEEPEKPQNPEEYAKKLYKKYKHQVSLPYDGSIPYAVFIIRALDHAIEEFDKSALFSRWISLKQYQGVDYQAKIVHQTLTPEGFVEPPTVAGAMMSSMLPFFLTMMAGSEAGLNLEFMVDVLEFHRKYEGFSKNSSQGSQSSSTASSSRKDMVEEARRIYGKYLETGDMYCDPHLVEEVHNTITKGGGKSITADLFRKCGAFIYQRSEHSWARQARATIVWTNKSYDNRSKKARAVEDFFSMSVLPEGTDLQLVPTVDDTLACSELMRDYADFIGKEFNDAFAKFRAAYEEYFKAPVHQRKPLLAQVSKTFAEVAKIQTDLEPIARVFENESSKRERISDSALAFLSSSVIKSVAKKYYSRWIIEHSMKWKTTPWSPVPALNYSDMSGVFGMAAVERQIEDAALKGKSGLARILAKRQVKKHAVANVRTAPAKEVTGSNKDMYATKNAGDMLAFGDMKGVSSNAAGGTLTVPTINETLGSSYLRGTFELFTLSTSLSTVEMSLWEALNGFYNKYSILTDEELADGQDRIRAEVDGICDKFQNLLPKVAEIKERLQKLKIVFPHFFRPYEVDLYSTHHTEFEKVLRAKGWK